MNLYAAIEKGNIEEVARLILSKKERETQENFGLYINSYHPFNETPLQLSLRQGKYKIVLLLLEEGADPNYYYKIENAKEYLAPLSSPLLSGDRSLIKLLILYGATIPDIEFDKEDKSNKTFALDIQVLASKQKTKLQQALKAESDNDFVAAFLNFKVVASIWSEMSQDEPDIDFKQHYQKKAWSFCMLSEECYEKIAGMEQQLQYQAEYNTLILLKETLQSQPEVNVDATISVNNENKRVNAFFRSISQCFRRLIHHDDKDIDATVLQPLVSRNNTDVNSKKSLKM